MIITAQDIKKVMPQAKDSNIQLYLPYWNKYLDQYEITTPLRLQGYFAQIAHESGQLNVIQENLNYSGIGLMKTWPSRFTLAKAMAYNRKPEKIANYVYANRMGNGPEESGDGWRHRGVGLIQITGKEAHRNYSRAIYKDDRCVTAPEILRFPEDCVLSSLWFWKNNNLNLICDTGDIRRLTQRINGGLKGLEDRIKFYQRAKTVFI